MSKKDIVKAIVSGAAGYAAFRELGDSFDDEVGVIRTVGRLGLMFTASILAAVLTDSSIETAYKFIFRSKEDEPEDSVFEEDIDDDFFEEEETEDANAEVKEDEQ